MTYETARALTLVIQFLAAMLAYWIAARKGRPRPWGYSWPSWSGAGGPGDGTWPAWLTRCDRSPRQTSTTCGRTTRGDGARAGPETAVRDDGGRRGSWSSHAGRGGPRGHRRGGGPRGRPRGPGRGTPLVVGGRGAACVAPWAPTRNVN